MDSVIDIIWNSKLEITAIAPNPLNKGNETSSYKISPKTIDQSILCVCRSEVYLITLGQESNTIFNGIFLNKVFDAVSVKDASVKLAENKKDIIFTCAFYENPIFIGRFWFIFLKRLNSKQIRTKNITEIFYFDITVTTGSPYGDFAFYFDGFEYNNNPAITINPIDGVSFVINSFLINNTTGKINGVRLQARKNGTWLVTTELSVTGTVIGQ